MKLVAGVICIGAAALVGACGGPAKQPAAVATATNTSQPTTVAGTSAATTAASPSATAPSTTAASPSTTPTAGLPVIPIGAPPAQPAYGVVRPTSLHNGADARNLIYEITWAYWTASGALGHGTRCADPAGTACIGPNTRQIPTTLTLSRPVNGQFTRIDETFTSIQGAPVHNSATTADYPYLFDTAAGGTRTALPTAAPPAQPAGSAYPCPGDCNDAKVLASTLFAHEVKSGIGVKSVTCTRYAPQQFRCGLILTNTPGITIPAAIRVSPDGHTYWITSSG